MKPNGQAESKNYKKLKKFHAEAYKKHIEQSMEQKRAVAAAYSEARRKGYKVPKKRKQSARVKK